jgi:hypothetical protein
MWYYVPAPTAVSSSRMPSGRRGVARKETGRPVEERCLANDLRAVGRKLKRNSCDDAGDSFGDASYRNSLRRVNGCRSGPVIRHGRRFFCPDSPRYLLMGRMRVEWRRDEKFGKKRQSSRFLSSPDVQERTLTGSRPGGNTCGNTSIAGYAAKQNYRNTQDAQNQAIAKSPVPADNRYTVVEHVRVGSLLAGKLIENPRSNRDNVRLTGHLQGVRGVDRGVTGRACQMD